MAKTIVTGGAGFIGSHLVDALLAQGDEVLVIDDFSTGLERNLDSAKSAGGSRLKVEKVDIADPKVVAVIAQFQPDRVFHFAAQMNVRRSVSEPSFDARSNVVGTVNILEGAKQAGAKQVVFSSTGGAIYGEQETFPAAEDHPFHPESAYGVSKAASELYLEYYSRLFKLNAVSLRFANVYGPRQNPKGEAGVVAIFCKQLLQGEPLSVNGDGKQTRDFVYVDDVIKANLAISSRPDSAKFVGKFEVFNVGTGIESSVLDIAENLKAAAKESGKVKDVAIKNGPALPGEQRRSVICPAKLGKEVAWKPAVDLRAGLKATLNSF